MDILTIEVGDPGDVRRGLLLLNLTPMDTMDTDTDHTIDLTMEDTGMESKGEQ